MKLKTEEAKELLLYYKKILERKLKNRKKDILDFLKGEKDIELKSPEIPTAIGVFIPFLIVLQAFYPSFLNFLTLILSIPLIIIVAIFVVVLIFVGGIGLLGASIFARFAVSFGIILAILTLLPSICNLITGRTSPAIYETISKMRTIQLPPLLFPLVTTKFVIFPGGLIESKILALIFFVPSLIIFPLIGSKIKSFGGFCIYNLFLIFLLYYLPIAIFTSSTFIQYLLPWQIRSYLKGEYIEEIPGKGGITITFGSGETVTPPKVIAGSPYFYTFTVTNNYEKNISITFNPFIEVLYKGKYLKFFTNTTSLNMQAAKNKSYPIPISLVFDPKKMKLENNCPYAEDIIRSYWHLDPEEEVECALGKNCTGNKACIKIMSFLCECVNWSIATCNGDIARIGLNYNHTGFLRGKATLYYGEEYKEIPTQKFIQGPLTVYATFIPNPWIDKYYREYQDKVILRLEAEGSGEITIENITLNLTKVSIITNIEGYSEELKKPVNFTMVEEISLNLRNCTYIYPKGEKPKISGEGRALIYRCEFDPPSINITVKELKVLKESYVTQVNYAELNKYCSYGFEAELMKTFKNKKVAKELASILEKSPLCKAKEGKGEIKEKSKEEIKELIESTLRRIDVGFEIDYIRKSSTYSYWTDINKNTPTCEDLKKQ